MLTRAQAKVNSTDADLWQELPFPVGLPGGKETQVSPLPPLNASVVEVTDFGQAQKDDYIDYLFQ